MLLALLVALVESPAEGAPDLFKKINFKMLLFTHENEDKQATKQNDKIGTFPRV